MTQPAQNRHNGLASEPALYTSQHRQSAPDGHVVDPSGLVFGFHLISPYPVQYSLEAPSWLA